MSAAAPTKPLGRKAYGSIPHLPDSRLGPGDHKIEAGQCRLLTATTRDRHDEVIVQEKLDGSNVAVCRTVDGDIVALGRAGWPCWSSPHLQHQYFACWVNDNIDLFDFLLPMTWVSGEWMAMAHGTVYDTEHSLWSPFIAFDIWAEGARLNYDEFMTLAAPRFRTPRILHRGGACSLPVALDRLGKYGWHGAKDPAEGVVYRMERKGKVEFLAKWVRPDKTDGKYFAEVSGMEPVWLWKPSSV